MTKKTWYGMTGFNRLRAPNLPNVIIIPLALYKTTKHFVVS